jgi:hypothetical protein
VDVIDRLHASLDQRLMPEQVAALILTAIGGELLPVEQRVLGRAVASRQAFYSSMSDDFERPVPLVHKVRMLLTLLGRELSDEHETQLAGDPWQLLGQLRIVGPFVGWHPDADFASRHNREQRANSNIGLSKRKYNRIVRHLLRTQDQARRLQRQIMMRQLVIVSRAGLAYNITAEQMRRDRFGACFVAYWTAQRNRRRQFTLAGRDNPFDPIAQMLLTRCMTRRETDWWMIARAYPKPLVLARLDDESRGVLMAEWFGFMRTAADMLREAYAAWPTREIEPLVPDEMWAARPAFMPSRESRGARTETVVDRSRMVVKKGVDSSTWNTLAGAYNAARAGWMNCIAASGALEMLDAVCPPKAMRLMAGDLVAMHGGDVDPETRVWATLPLPWEVLADEAICTATTVVMACREQGVDPEAKGWVAPRQEGAPAEWKATPELVHGVEVNDPLWAGLLRRAGVFSGKGVDPHAAAMLGSYYGAQHGGQE